MHHFEIHILNLFHPNSSCIFAQCISLLDELHKLASTSNLQEPQLTKMANSKIQMLLKDVNTFIKLLLLIGNKFLV